MIRAAAKNHADVTVVVEPDDYAAVLAELDARGGATGAALRQRLAQKAFARTAAYDAAISKLVRRGVGRVCAVLPRVRRPAHPGAALRREPASGRRPSTPRRRRARASATARQLQGKELSYNNVNDTDAAFEVVAEFDPARTAAVAIIKHANPCGVAEGATLREAYLRALRCDPVSAFGGIVALNRTLEAEAAAEIVKIFTEVIIAPDATPEAIALVAGKKNLRLLVTGGLPDPRAPGLVYKPVAGGLLVQTRDAAVVDDLELRVVTRRVPTSAEWQDLRFAFRVAKHVKSNAIVYAKDGATVGIGAGQMSRLDSSRIAASKAAEAAQAAGLPASLAKGAVVASDAFFPFADGMLAAAEAGVTAVIQPGGSMRDGEVIAAADAAGLAMVFTDTRHFRH